MKVLESFGPTRPNTSLSGWIGWQPWRCCNFFVETVVDVSNNVIPEEKIIRIVPTSTIITKSRKHKKNPKLDILSFVEKLLTKPRALLSEQNLVLCRKTRFVPVLKQNDMQKQIFVLRPRHL